MGQLVASDPCAEALDERLIAYSVAMEQAFSGLRSLIGQLSGLLILAQARLCRDISELPEIAIARERWHEAMEQLGRLHAPQRRAGDREQLQQAAGHIDRAIVGIAQIRRAHTDESVAVAADHLQAAYRLMQNICDHRLGLSMVNMSDACCNCGKLPAWKSQNRQSGRVGA